MMERLQTIARGTVDTFDDSQRKVVLSFSSEEAVPGQLTGGTEILDHSDGAADLSRLNDIGCLLFNHDTHTVLGKITRAWISEGRGYAEVEFDSDSVSEGVYQKVKSGTLRCTSVRCRVNKWEHVAKGRASTCGRFIGPAAIARKWTPLEISIVTIPADATVGVGRQYTEEDYCMQQENMGVIEVKDEKTAQGETLARQEQVDGSNVLADKNQEQTDMRRELANKTLPALKDAGDMHVNEVERALNEERARIAEIGELCREFGVNDSEFIKSGAAVSEVQRQILNGLSQTRRPVSTSVERDEQDKFRAAASDGLILRSGGELKSAAPGADDFRGVSLRDLAVECLAREGITRAHMMDNDTLMRQFFNPVSAFPSIMDMTIEKAYRQGYETVAVTFDKWTTKGSLKDFKETRGNYYIAGPAGEFLLVPENGELKADIPEDTLLPQRKLNTYGRQFTMTRQAFINDDIGFLTTLPSRYAASAKRTINKQVYDVLMNNPVIYDGTPLFGDNHRNVMATGTRITNEALRKMINTLKRQKDHFGQPIMIDPKFLIVPVGLGFEIMSILRSPTINTPDNTQAVNPMYNYPFSVIEEPALGGIEQDGKPAPWFFAANPTGVRTIQVDYLNGQETPTIRRMENAGQLGFIWDIYLDWGVSVLDYRGLLKNPGVIIEDV